MSKTEGEMVKRNRRSEEDEREMESECVRIHSNLTFKGECLWNGTLRTKIEKEITNKVRKNGLTKTTSSLPLISCFPPPPQPPPLLFKCRTRKHIGVYKLYICICMFGFHHFWIPVICMQITSIFRSSNRDFKQATGSFICSCAVLVLWHLIWRPGWPFEGSWQTEIKEICHTC